MLKRLVLTLLCFGALVLSAADWAQWRGPERNGKSTEKNWLSQWPSKGPKLLWEANVGKGFSAFTIAGGRAYISGNKDNQDSIYCFDIKTGKEVWVHRFAEPLHPKYYPGGTSASISIHDGIAYSFSKSGKAYALDAVTGKIKWSNDINKTTGIEMPTWGFASTPLILKDRIILNAGKSGVCLNREDGKLIWKSANEKSGYSTPCPINENLVAIFGNHSLYAVNPENGKIKWQQEWKTKYGENNADVLIADGHIYLTATHDMGTAKFKLTESGLELVWKNKLGMQLNGLILHDGFLYGCDGRVNRKQGSFFCINDKDGKTVWNQDGIKGSSIFADGKLIIMTHSGELLVAEASSKAYKDNRKKYIF